MGVPIPCDVENCPAPVCPFVCYWYERMKERDALRSRISELEQENATLIAMQAWYEGEVERLREGLGDIKTALENTPPDVEVSLLTARSTLETQPKGDEEDE